MTAANDTTSIPVSIMKRGIGRYVRNAEAVALIVDACDDNIQRLQALMMNGVPHAVASALLRAAGYTRPDLCADCERPVDQSEAVYVARGPRLVRHAARCPS